MNSQEIGSRIRSIRKAQGLTQAELALTANTAPRFISDLENGKSTCQIGKMLDVMASLGIRLELLSPETEDQS
jgi:HTH-type transcriptional regulator/antitoxin HipB